MVTRGDSIAGLNEAAIQHGRRGGGRKLQPVAKPRETTPPGTKTRRGVINGKQRGSREGEGRTGCAGREGKSIRKSGVLSANKSAPIKGATDVKERGRLERVRETMHTVRGGT